MKNKTVTVTEIRALLKEATESGKNLYAREGAGPWWRVYYARKTGPIVYLFRASDRSRLTGETVFDVR